MNAPAPQTALAERRPPIVPVGRANVSVSLRSRMEGELKGMMNTRRNLVADIAMMQRRLEDLEMSISAAADMITRIDRETLTQRLQDEATGEGNQG
jgi:hypothetical protein